jgi:hypothetical protein
MTMQLARQRTTRGFVSTLAGMRRVLAVVLLIALGGWEPFRALDPDVEAGNLAYAEGRYDDALAAYDRAARRGSVDPDGLAYDRGTAQLKRAESATDPDQKRRLTERALADLQQAGRARDPRVRGAAHYNRGNLLMAQDKLDEAIDAYKQALRDDPGLDDARLNLELALRRRQKQPQRPPQGQQGQGQQGQGQQGQGQGQQGQGQGQQGQGQGQQGQDPPSQDSQGQGSGSSSSGGGSGDPQNGSSGQGSASPQSGPGSRGATPPPDPQGNGQGSSRPPDADDPGAQDPSNGAPPPRGRSSRDRASRLPRTPIEGRLDDLEEFSRRLRKHEARRHATGRSSDPQHDW